MRPGAPATRDPVLASWAGDVIDYIGSKLRYVPNPNLSGVISRTYPNNVTVELELTELPANDPTVVAAHVGIMVRETSTSSRVLSIYDGRDRTKRYGFVGASGVASRGSGTGGFMVPVGGTNNRSVGLHGSTSTTASCWVTVFGWWVRDSVEPASGSTAPITGMPAPSSPAPDDQMLSEWAAGLLQMAGRAWSWVPISETNGPTYTVAGTYDWDVSAIIPPDPRIVAASVGLRIRPSDTTDRNLTVYDADGSWAGSVWSQGVAAQYAHTGHWPVLLGGTRSIRFLLNGAVTDAIGVIYGYWMSDSEVDG